jgi:hypothetical protein
MTTTPTPTAYCPTCARPVIARAPGITLGTGLAFTFLAACTCGLGLVLAPLLFASGWKKACPLCKGPVRELVTAGDILARQELERATPPR